MNYLTTKMKSYKAKIKTDFMMNKSLNKVFIKFVYK